jgi:hypothetical protein
MSLKIAPHTGCAAKVDAHVKQTVAAKPKLVQISTAYSKPAEGSPIVPRNQYVEIRQEKPKNKYQQEAPEYKTCKYITEAIVADGSEKGEIRKVCANPECPVHHPKKQRRQVQADASMKAEGEKRRREEAQAKATGMRVLKAIGEAVPVRLMKRDLLIVAARQTAMLSTFTLCRRGKSSTVIWAIHFHLFTGFGRKVTADRHPETEIPVRSGRQISDRSISLFPISRLSRVLHFCRFPDKS